MQEGQKAALNLANWHHFLSALTLAGYRGEKMISSETSIIYSYVLYLIGIRDYAIGKGEMRQAIAEFFFMAALTGRYTNSAETRFDSDLSMLREMSVGTAFLAKLRELCATTLTGDYWTITLPNQLATSASRSPSLFAYQASLIRLDALVLYSPLKIAAMVDPVIKGTKAALEQHHLFPRGYLEDNGVTNLKQINQIANFAAVEWPANIRIGKKPPADYVKSLDAAVSAPQREQLYFWHALPPLWWELSYEQFLVERRVCMAKVIQMAWKQLAGELPETAPSAVSLTELIESGESDAVEFKSTLRTNLHTGQADEKIQMAALKTIAGFLNAKGGVLLVGVADSGEVIGIGADSFANEDKMGLHIVRGGRAVTLTVPLRWLKPSRELVQVIYALAGVYGVGHDPVSSAGPFRVSFGFPDFPKAVAFFFLVKRFDRCASIDAFQSIFLKPSGSWISSAISRASISASASTQDFPPPICKRQYEIFSLLQSRIARRSSSHK